MSPNRQLIIDEVVGLAFLTATISNGDLYIIGTVSQMLRGINVDPRDIDLLVSGISITDFEETVLSTLGYSLDMDFCWCHHNGVGKSGLMISSPNHIDDQNIFAAFPDLSFGWQFEERFWQKIKLSEEVFVKIPVPALSLILKFKSISDKIFLSQNTDEPDKTFWNTLLINDLKCIEEEFDSQSDTYFFEDVWLVLGQLPRDLRAANQILKAIQFTQLALTTRSVEWTRKLSQVSRIVSIYFDHFQSSGFIIPTKKTPDLFFNDLGIRVLGNRKTGLIVAEATDDFNLSKWVPSRPLLADVQLNSSCNLRCAHCDYSMTGSEISFELLAEKLRDIQSAGVLQVNFGEASEALLYKNLSQALHLTAQLGMTPNLTTNLSIEPDHDLWNAIVTNCGTVAVSIDNFHFTSVSRDRKLLDVKKRINRLVSSGANVTINTVYDTGATGEIAEIIETATKLNCKAVCIIRRFYDSAKMYNKISLRDFEDIITSIQKTPKTLAVGFHSSDPISKIFETAPSSDCLAPLTESRHTIYLDSCGVFRPSSFCAQVLDSKTTCLNAWTSPQFENFRQSTKNGMQFKEKV